MEKDIYNLSAQVGSILSGNALTISVAESCTGGLLSHVLTGVSGSSSYFIGGVVAYSNQIKRSILGVAQLTLETYGAVNEQTAAEMAAGIRQKFNSDLGLSTTGIAGPTGGTPSKPVGLVWIAISTKSTTRAWECHFIGSREDIKMATVHRLLTVLIDTLQAT